MKTKEAIGQLAERDPGPQPLQHPGKDVLEQAAQRDSRLALASGWELPELARFTPTLVTLAIGANDIVQERTPDEYRELSPTPDQWGAFSAAVGKMWDTLPAFSADQLRSIKVPTVIADGEYDEAIKQSHDRYMAETIPGARLAILPNVSHFAMLQNPQEFDAAVLDFLKHP